MTSLSLIAHTTRRGAALLIVLATLIITMTTMTTLVQAATSVQASRNIDRCARVADDLVIAADAPITQWLREKSSTIVLPPDARSPQIEVLHDAWALDAVQH